MVELGYNVFFGFIGLAAILVCIQFALAVLLFVLRNWRELLFVCGLFLAMGAFVAFFYCLRMGQLRAARDAAAAMLLGALLLPPYWFAQQKWERARDVWLHFGGVCPACKGAVVPEKYEQPPRYQCQPRVGCGFHLGAWDGHLAGEVRGAL